MGLDRVRSNPKLAVAIACGLILVIAWIAWAIHVTSDHGSRAGLGVILAWPALVGALALISLPFIGGYLLLRSDRTSDEADGAAPATETAAQEEQPAKG